MLAVLPDKKNDMKHGLEQLKKIWEIIFVIEAAEPEANYECEMVALKYLCTSAYCLTQFCAIGFFASSLELWRMFGLLRPSWSQSRTSLPRCAGISCCRWPPCVPRTPPYTALQKSGNKSTWTDLELLAPCECVGFGAVQILSSGYSPCSSRTRSLRQESDACPV